MAVLCHSILPFVHLYNCAAAINVLQSGSRCTAIAWKMSAVTVAFGDEEERWPDPQTTSFSISVAFFLLAISLLICFEKIKKLRLVLRGEKDMFVPCAAIQQLLLPSYPPTALSIPPNPRELPPGSKYSSLDEVSALFHPPALILSISVDWVGHSSGSLWVVVGAPARGFREPAVWKFEVVTRLGSTSHVRHNGRLNPPQPPNPNLPCYP